MKELLCGTGSCGIMGADPGSGGSKIDAEINAGKKNKIVIVGRFDQAYNRDTQH